MKANMFQGGGSRLLWFLFGTFALLFHHHVARYAAFAYITTSSSSGNSARGDSRFGGYGEKWLSSSRPVAGKFRSSGSFFCPEASRHYWSSSLSFYRSEKMDETTQQPNRELNYISTSLEQSNTTIMDLEEQPEKQQHRRRLQKDSHFNRNLQNSNNNLSSLESVAKGLSLDEDDQERRADKMMLAVKDMEEEMDLAFTTQHVTEEVNQQYNEIFSHIQELDDLIGYAMLPLEMEITKQRQRQRQRQKVSTLPQRAEEEDHATTITTTPDVLPLMKHEAANKKFSKEAAATMEQTTTSSSSKEATRLLETEAKDYDDEAIRVRLKEQELCRRNMLAARLDYDRKAAAFVRQKQVVEKESLIKNEQETARRKMLEARLQYEKKKKKKVAVMEATQEAQEEEKQVGEEKALEEEQAALLKAFEVTTEMVSPKDLEEAEHISKEQIAAASEEDNLIKIQQELCRRSMLESRLQSERAAAAKSTSSEVVTQSKAEEAEAIQDVMRRRRNQREERFSQIKTQQEAMQRTIQENRQKATQEFVQVMANEVRKNLRSNQIMESSSSRRGETTSLMNTKQSKATRSTAQPKQARLDATRVESLDKFAEIKRQQESAMRKQFAIRREAQLDFARVIANEVGNRRSFRRKEEIERRPYSTESTDVEDDGTPEPPKTAVVTSTAVDSISEAVDLGTSRTDMSTAAILPPSNDSTPTTDENKDVKEIEKGPETVEIVAEQLHKKQEEFPLNRIDTSVISTSSPDVTFTTTEKMENDSYEKINQTVEVNAAEPLHNDKKQEEDEISSKQVPKKRPQPVKLQCNEMRSGGFGLRRW